MMAQGQAPAAAGPAGARSHAMPRRIEQLSHDWGQQHGAGGLYAHGLRGRRPLTLRTVRHTGHACTALVEVHHAVCLTTRPILLLHIPLFSPGLCPSHAVDDDAGELRAEPSLRFPHDYPATKLMFIPDRCAG